MLELRCIVFIVAFIVAMIVIRNRIFRKAKQDVKGFIGSGLQESNLAVDYGSFVKLEGIGVANNLSIFRLVAGFAVSFIYLTQWFGEFSNWVAFGLWVVAMFTDTVDGTIAKIRKETTAFGREFDPVADKAAQYLPFVGLIVHCAMVGKIGLVVPSVIVLAALIGILLRDVVLLTVFGLKKCREQKSIVINKLRAVAIAVYIGTVAVMAAGVTFIEAYMVKVVVLVALALSVASLIVDYLRIAFPKTPVE